MDFDTELKKFKEYLTKKGLSAIVIDYYPEEVKKFFEFTGKSDADDIDEFDFLNYRKFLEQEYNAGAVTKKMSAVKKWFEFKWEENPFGVWYDRWEKINRVRLRTIKDKNRDRGFKPVPLDYLKKLEETAKDMDLETYLLIKMLTTYGIRAGQLYSIKVQDIHFDGQPVPFFEFIAKGKKRIKLPLTDEIKDLIKIHLNTRNYNSEFLFKNGRDPYVDDPDEANRNMKNNDKNVERILKRVCEKANLPPITPHQIRRTIGEYAEYMGLELETAKDLFGHSSTLITRGSYGFKYMIKLKEALENRRF